MALGGLSFLFGLTLAAALALLLAHPAVHEWNDNVRPSAREPASTAAGAASSSSTPSPAAPPRPAPLSRFLDATTVEHALAAAKLFAVEYGTDSYASSLRHLVAHEWYAHPQGVYNLLQHSYMLPADIRFATMHRGLHEPDDTQYRLAAAVGLQFTPNKFLEKAPNAERAFRQTLLQYAAEHDVDDFLAARSFLAVKDRLAHPRDTKFVLALLGGLTWRNCLTWLLQHASPPDQPLTTDRLRSMLSEAIEAERAGSPSADPAADPTAAEWTGAWSQRLQSLDVDSLMLTAGAALTDHWERVAARQHSRLSRYQEIDIPDYAPLQMGFADDATAAPLHAHQQAAGQQAQEQLQPQSAAAAAASPDRPPAAADAAPVPRIDPQAAFQPDVVLQGVPG